MSWCAIIGNGLAWFLAWLFIEAAFYKLSAPQYYRRLMARYVGRVGAGKAVWLIASLEAIIALCLVLPASRRVGLALAAALLCLYAGLMASRILRGEGHMECGCAGPDSQLGISWALVIRNGVCAVLALLAMSSGANPGAQWVSFVLSLAVSVSAIMVYALIEEVISNAQWMAGDG